MFLWLTGHPEVTRAALKEKELVEDTEVLPAEKWPMGLRDESKLSPYKNVLHIPVLCSHQKEDGSFAEAEVVLWWLSERFRPFS